SSVISAPIDADGTRPATGPDDPAATGACGTGSGRLAVCVGVLDQAHREIRQRPRVRVGLVLVGRRVNGVRPGGTAAGDGAQRIGEGVDVLAGGGETQGHPGRPGQALVMAGTELV